MKKLILLLSLLAISGRTMAGQNVPAVSANSVIESANITGVPEQNISEPLRESIGALVGQRYDAEVAERLANQIQAELPDTVAAFRTQAGTSPDRVRLVFVVARSTEATAAADSNVNSQYTVETVEVKGVDRSRYSNALYDEMQKMVGLRVDNKMIEELRSRFNDEVQGQYFISQKIERGSQPEHVRVLFEAERTPWLWRATLGKVIKANVGGGSIHIGSDQPNDSKTVAAVDVKGVARTRLSDALFSELQAMVGKRTDSLEANHLLEKLKAELTGDYAVALRITDGATPQESRIVYAVDRVPWLPYRNPRDMLTYHSKQGFSLLCCDDDFIGDYTTLTVGWDGDSLVERYKGFGLGIESTSLGTRHLGARLAFESFGSQWKQATRTAVADRADSGSGLELYRSRLSVAPSVAFAFNRHMYVTGGANFTQLRIEGPEEPWRAVHEGVASLRFDTKEVKHGQTTFESKGGYEVRSGARSIGTDLVFTRHLADLDASVGYEKNKLRLTISGGKITGNAPMFERFSLGNTVTLRGWNKYDINPAGGSRMWHSSLEYNYGDLGFFLDHGSVWDPGDPHPIRQSVGVTLWHSIGLAFPLQCSRQCGAMFYVHIQ